MLGKISLNLSMFLYLIVYLPQLAHNRQTQHLRHLSLSMHVLLFLGYGCDLLYGLATHLPWQYLMVSSVGLGLFSIQHLQILKHLQTTRHTYLRAFLLTSWLLIGLFILCLILFKPIEDYLPYQASLLGWLSRLLFTVCFIPQLFKNHFAKTNQALNRYYLGINITLTCLDFISAWCLNWGYPNKIGPLISLILLSLLLFKNSVAAKPVRLTFNFHRRMY